MFNKERPDVLFKHNTYGGKLLHLILSGTKST
jgi:hypothetical protein